MADALTLATGRAARLVHSAGDPPELAGRSAAIGRVQELLRRAAGLDGGVLFVAERGIEVEPVARELHARSRRSSAPFVAVACGAGDPARLDRLLFGAPIAGALPDLEVASADSRLAAARGGTLFLEELSELPATVQARLARVARDGEVRIDGDAGTRGDPRRSRARRRASTPTCAITACARISTAGSRRRSSICRRSASAPRTFRRSSRGSSKSLSEADGLPRPTFTRAALALLASLTWPGNLAELRAALARVAAQARRRDDSDRGAAAGAAARPRAGAVRAGRQPPRRAAQVRARLHRGRPPASRLAHRRRRPHPGDPASKPLSQGPAARHPAAADLRAVVHWHNNESTEDAYEAPDFAPAGLRPRSPGFRAAAALVRRPRRRRCRRRRRPRRRRAPGRSSPGRRWPRATRSARRTSSRSPSSTRPTSRATTASTPTASSPSR